jgi:hypothetical protein
MAAKKLTIAAAWNAFEQDLIIAGLSGELIESYKKTWFAGALAMGFIITSEHITAEDSFNEFMVVKRKWATDYTTSQTLKVKLTGH